MTFLVNQNIKSEETSRNDWENIQLINGTQIDKKIEWKSIDNIDNRKINRGIKWKKLKDDELNKHEIYKKHNKINKLQLNNNNIRNVNDNNFDSLELGKAVPTADTINGGELHLEASQVSTFSGGLSGGTGNQNYFGSIKYGIKDYITLTGFYTEADDPLYRRINKLRYQPENKWSNYGTAIRWRLLNNDKNKIAIEGSLENFRVGSGGCYGYNCKNESNNIFNLKKEKVINNNVITSLSIPITKKLNEKIKFTFAPKLSNLPNNQGNKNGKGKFYGVNYGFGIGTSYKINKKTNTFISSYIPINSTNSFNSNLIYENRAIYTLGLNYQIDQKINFEGYITNSFGQTPATSILSIPSSNEILYGGRVKYIPTNKRYAINSRKAQNLKIKNEKITHVITNGIRSDGYLYNHIDLKLSEKFKLILTNEKLPENIKTDSNYVKKYMIPGSHIIRGGGRTSILSKERGDLFNSNFTLTVGRTLGEVRPGYLFGELKNSIPIKNNVLISISPRIASTGTGSPKQISTGLEFKLIPKSKIEVNYNINIEDSENNTLLKTKSKINKDIGIEAYVTNGVGEIDMGTFYKTNGISYGITFNYIL